MQCCMVVHTHRKTQTRAHSSHGHNAGGMTSLRKLEKNVDYLPTFSPDPCMFSHCADPPCPGDGSAGPRHLPTHAHMSHVPMSVLSSFQSCLTPSHSPACNLQYHAQYLPKPLLAILNIQQLPVSGLTSAVPPQPSLPSLPGKGSHVSCLSAHPHATLCPLLHASLAIGNCADDIKRMCDDVDPGQSRLADCISDHITESEVAATGVNRVWAACADGGAGGGGRLGPWETCGYWTLHYIMHAHGSRWVCADLHSECDV